MGDVIDGSRTALLNSILDRPAEAHLITGPFGIGKTKLLNNLGDQLRASGCVVLRVVVPDSPESTEPATRSLDKFRQCLDIAKQLGDQLAAHGEPRLSRNVAALARRAQFNSINIDQSITATDGASVHADRAQSVHFHWGEYLTMMDGLLSDEVTAAVNHRMRKSAIAILIDDIHHLEGLHSEAWLLDVLRRTPGARVIATRRSSSSTPPLLRAFSQHPVGRLTRQDVAMHLESRLGTTANTALVDLVCAATGSLPWAVAFLTERLVGSPSMTRRELLGLLESDNVGSDLADLVDMCLVRLPQNLRLGLDRLSILRDFDRRAGAYMLAELPLTEDPDALLRNLSQAHLLDVATSDEQGHEQRLARSSDPASFETCMHVPDIIRTAVTRQNSRRDPFYLAVLHRRAAEFYRMAVGQTSLALRDPFSHWAAIEGSVSQRYLSEWIYHVANSAEKISNSERSKILRWYLEGFFWYDWKVPHWFCQRFLGYCEEIRRAHASVEWLDCLQSFHRHCPRGWQKDADRATWKIVTDALIQLRGYVRQPGGPPAKATDSSQVYALATFLLAESLYFSRTNLKVAAERYEEAARWFVGEDNTWCRTYVTLLQADLAVQSGDLSIAQASFESLLAAAKRFEDIEMFCHVLLMRADERWLSGHPGEAITANILAALHAITYQVRQIFLPEMVHFPDAYTREVYEETVARASAHLDQLGYVDAALAAAARRSVKRIFAAFWEYNGTVSLDSFPPPPADSDLGRPEGDYVSRVRWLAESQDSLLWNLDVTPEAIGMGGP